MFNFVWVVLVFGVVLVFWNFILFVVFVVEYVLEVCSIGDVVWELYVYVIDGDRFDWWLGLGFVVIGEIIFS